jgi:tetratricopeptide (TPR) repeat protein
LTQLRWPAHDRETMVHKLGVAMRCVSTLAFAMLVMLLGIAPSHAEKRVALVIGNSSYRGMPPLPNPKNDATDMAAALHHVGFETILATDLDKRGMDDAFRRFARLARDADAALFFYAGHGMQFAGTNYLMPVDAKLQDDADVTYELAKVDDVIADLSRAKNIRIVILDACRDNPLAERLRMRLPASRSAAVSRGLARIERSQGLITAFATQPGQVAADGVKTRNSPFTRALLKYIATPGIEAGMLFRRVAQEVNQSTGGKQLPELSVSLLGEFYFAGQAPGSATVPAATPTNEAELAWAALGDTTSIAVLEEFIGRFGDSFYVTLARARLEELRKRQVTMLIPPPAAEPNRTSADILNSGKTHQQRGEHDLAIADFTEAIRLDPMSATAYTNRGKAYYGKRDYDRAIADHSEAIRLDPKNANAYSSRGAVYSLKGSYDLALRDSNEAIRLNPKFSMTFSNRGFVYNNMGNYDLALADLNEAIRLDPNNAWAHKNLGISYENKGDLEKALAEYKLAIKLAPNSSDPGIQEAVEGAKRVARLLTQSSRKN